ncbi:MAG: 4-hydroxythreonine-4-phosphate dehydrogenase PdxA, partial [Candidatus Omnitrophica bacterium]|nr:4-hydroxythreonine-4-phosphate dehydrogenase PdxA [Candidatus Omnitrophota bacterium]
PLSKEAVQSIKKKFSGHTEYLQDHFRAAQVEMMMVSKQLKVVLLTRHTVLRKAGALINSKDVAKTLELVYTSLKQQFKIKKPRIVLASFNPHAGVDTFLEKEEKEIVSGISKFKGKTYGPYPADSLFTKDNLKLYDCVISTYHDQAMIPFKLLSMKDGINLTLGLPVIRTSPAHGPAFDLIRQDKKPFSSSMLEAIKLAVQLTN